MITVLKVYAVFNFPTHHSRELQFELFYQGLYWRCCVFGWLLFCFFPLFLLMLEICRPKMRKCWMKLRHRRFSNWYCSKAKGLISKTLPWKFLVKYKLYLNLIFCMPNQFFVPQIIAVRLHPLLWKFSSFTEFQNVRVPHHSYQLKLIFGTITFWLK